MAAADGLSLSLIVRGPPCVTRTRTGLIAGAALRPWAAAEATSRAGLPAAAAAMLRAPAPGATRDIDPLPATVTANGTSGWIVYEAWQVNRR